MSEGSTKVVPIRVVRDTCSTVSIVVKAVVPFVEKSYSLLVKQYTYKESLDLRGYRMYLCHLFLYTGYEPYYVNLAVVEKALPVKGVVFCLNLLSQVNF